MKKLYVLLLVLVLAAIVASIVLVTNANKKNNNNASQDTSSAVSVPVESVPVQESSVPEEESAEISEPEASSEPEPAESEDESSEDESSEPEESSEEEPATTAEAIVRLAYKLIGTEYKYGGIGPDTFDNSGFTYYVCRECGVKAPRLVGGMMSFGEEIGRDGLEPGDILIFRNEIDGPPAFMGIYVGNNQFIACNNETTPTKLQTISPYWENRFVCGRRVG